MVVVALVVLASLRRLASDRRLMDMRGFGGSTWAAGSGGGGEERNRGGEMGADKGGDAIDPDGDARFGLLARPRTGSLDVGGTWVGVDGAPGWRKEEVRGAMAWPMESAAARGKRVHEPFAVLGTGVRDRCSSSAVGSGQGSPSCERALLPAVI